VKKSVHNSELFEPRTRQRTGTGSQCNWSKFERTASHLQLEDQAPRRSALVAVHGVTFVSSAAGHAVGAKLKFVHTCCVSVLCGDTRMTGRIRCQRTFTVVVAGHYQRASSRRIVTHLTTLR